jgi:hypothetical protein
MSLSDVPPDNNIVDSLLRSDDMVEGGVHALQWKTDHWRCGCGREFTNADVDIAAFESHAPDAKMLAVMSSHTDPDVQLAAARISHALATRVPKRAGSVWLHLPLSHGKDIGVFTRHLRGKLPPDDGTS